MCSRARAPSARPTTDFDHMHLRHPPDEPPVRLGAHLAPKQRQQGEPLRLVGVLRGVVLAALGAGDSGNVLGDLGRHAVDAVAARGSRALNLVRFRFVSVERGVF